MAKSHDRKKVTANGVAICKAPNMKRANVSDFFKNKYFIKFIFYTKAYQLICLRKKRHI